VYAKEQARAVSVHIGYITTSRDVAYFQKGSAARTNQQLLLPDVTGCHGDHFVNAAEMPADFNIYRSA